MDTCGQVVVTIKWRNHPTQQYRCVEASSSLRHQLWSKHANSLVILPLVRHAAMLATHTNGGGKLCLRSVGKVNGGDGNGIGVALRFFSSTRDRLTTFGGMERISERPTAHQYQAKKVRGSFATREVYTECSWLMSLDAPVSSSDANWRIVKVSVVEHTEFTFEITRSPSV